MFFVTCIILACLQLWVIEKILPRVSKQIGVCYYTKQTCYVTRRMNMIRCCHCFSASILSKPWLSSSQFFGIFLLGTRWLLELTICIPGRNQRERWPEPTFIPLDVQKNIPSEKDSVSRICLLMPYLSELACRATVKCTEDRKSNKIQLVLQRRWTKEKIGHRC